MATPKRTGGAKADVVAGNTPAGRRAARKAAGPGATTDNKRDQAYRQGQAAAKRALDERRPGRRAKGPAQVHDDPELQEYYEHGHAEHLRDARRTAVSERLGGPATSAKSAGENGAGFVLGLIAFALLRNYLQGGWSGVGQWFSAKFVNKTGGSAAPSKPVGPGGPQVGRGTFGPKGPYGTGPTGPSGPGPANLPAPLPWNGSGPAGPVGP